MFGNVSSSWANPQQNQQQQTPSAFGQPSAFGATNTTNAFGSTSAFGQPQQQQQQANPMFGNLSTPAQNTGTSGFGGFGPTTNNTASTFGAKPTTGFGAFGGGTAFGGTGTSTSTFGQPATGATTTTGTGLFGQPAATTGTTGTFGGTGLFGQNKPSVFGASSLATTTPPVVTTGTSNPPYAAHTNKEEGGTFQYQSISCIPAYQGYSLEELRVQDYTQGRKTASTGGAFGQTTTFGQPSTTATGLFGSTQPAQHNTTSTFGTTPAAPTTAFGGFGSTQPATTQPTGGLFGNTAFGSTATQQQPAQTNAFGGFGQTQQQQPAQPQQSSGLFGGSTAFGNTANKPAGFGTFGTATAPTTNAFGGGTTFGATQPQQPAQTGGLFGNTQQPQGTTGAFGGTFGNTANKSLFGGTTANTQPAATGFGTFGTNTQQQQPQGQQSSGLFGGGGLFGNTQQQPQQQTAPTTALFGNTNTQTTNTGTAFGSGGLFGNAQNQQPNQQQQQPATGLFGAKPMTTATTGGLFGGGTTFGQPQNATNLQPTVGGLFGNSTLGQPANQQPPVFGSLFNKSAAAPMGASTSTGGTGLFGSTFGNSTNTLAGSVAGQGGQGILTASIAQPIGSNLPIFNMLPPGPRVVDLDQSQPKKKVPFFVDVPTRSPLPRVSQSHASAGSKLRGFGSSVAGQSNLGNPFVNSTSNTVSFVNGKPNALALSDARGSVGPDSFLGRSGSPALGSGSRQSVKKVILDKKVEPSQLFIKSGSPGIAGSKVVFSPALSLAARESEAAAAAAALNATPTPAPRNQQRSPNRFSAQSTKALGLQSGGASDRATLEEGDYYVKPDLAALKKLGYDELSSFQGLVVGRVGYGEIEFLEPVDLTGLPKLSALLGDVILFDAKECSVYPDSEDSDKPPPGSGLNARARLTLEKCWVLDKATREPIKDLSHPSASKHLKRLRNMKDTHFEDFDMRTGKWTFTVDHF